MVAHGQRLQFASGRVDVARGLIESRVSKYEKELRRAKRGAAQEYANAAASRARDAPPATQKEQTRDVSEKDNVALLHVEISKLTNERDRLAIRMQRDDAEEDCRVEAATMEVRVRVDALEIELQESRDALETSGKEVAVERGRADFSENKVRTLESEIVAFENRLDELETIRVEERRTSREHLDSAVKAARDECEPELLRIRHVPFTLIEVRTC